MDNVCYDSPLDCDIFSLGFLHLQHSARLTHLSLLHCHGLTENHFQALANSVCAGSLRHLDLEHSTISNPGLLSLAKTVTSLRYLSLKDCKDVTEESQCAILQSNPHLETFKAPPGTTVRIMTTIMELKLPLRELSVAQGTGTLTDSATLNNLFLDLSKSNPKLKIVIVDFAPWDDCVLFDPSSLAI
jgi:hypothetical protein